ncbi:uncharacterized protein JCM15063_006338 [Sporobolomyces koalae]|uniref:uncharacterized protein n=1 Tax=Sporobolomyces koalae TaxID=500713 RepID=UPI0031783D74
MAPRLTRSDSATSAWLVPTRASPLEDPLEHDQRRLRHLHTVMIRNLTLDPALDSLFARPTSLPSLADTPSCAQFDPFEPNGTETIVSLTGNGKEPIECNARRRPRATSNAPGHSNEELRHEQPPSSPTSPRSRAPSSSLTRIRRSDSVGHLLSPAQQISEEGEAQDGFPFPLPTPAQELASSTILAGTSSTSWRARSTSRASTHSNGTIGSTTSTIRQAPRLPPAPSPSSAAELSHRSQRSPTSALFAQRETKRRAEALRRRLLDSFISIEIVSTPAPPSEVNAPPPPSSRSRGNTISSSSALGGSTTPGIKRSDSSSSIKSVARRNLRRRRTVSTTFVTTKNVSERIPEPTSTRPVYVSRPAFEQVNPTFTIDPSDMLIPTSSSPLDDETTRVQFLDDSVIGSWEGWREGTIRVKVFARSRQTEREREVEKKSQAAKGKGKEKSAGIAQDEGRGFKLVTEWQVDLSSLVSLGRNPEIFPDLPPNTILFAFSVPSSPFSFSSSSSAASTSASTPATEIEYFTAPFDLLFRSTFAPGPRPRPHPRDRFRSSNSYLGYGRASWSDDEGNMCCSCSSSDDEATTTLEGYDSEGPIATTFGSESSDTCSDPGSRSRSGTTFSSSSSWGRTHRRRIQRPTSRGSHGPVTTGSRSSRKERVRLQEERRKKVEFVERSRRETRMVELAPLDVVERLWNGEQELDKLRRERIQVQERLVPLVTEGGVEAGIRERDDRRDRVGDLEAVGEAVREEAKDLERLLETKRGALEARKERLRKVRAMDQQNRQALLHLESELSEHSRTNSSLQAQISTRTQHVVTLLSHLYPIEPVLPTLSNPSPSPLLFSIHSLALPNSTYPASCSDEVLSSALGYAAHLTLLLAAYLRVPLCYPIIWRGSRSVVKDEISMMRGPRAFPLYGKGVDQYRFDYGVFLLNKNIEQLMYSRGLTVLDLRNTLPNLKTLVLSLSFGEWTEEYTRASLRPASPFGQVPIEEYDLVDREEEAQQEEGQRGTGASQSEPSTIPESSIESLPPREEHGVEEEDETSCTRSRSSSMASSSTIRILPTSRPSSPPPTSSSAACVATTARTKSQRSSSRDSKASTSTLTATKRSTGGNTIEKPLVATREVTAKGGIDGSKPVNRTRNRTGSGGSAAAGGGGYGSRFANSVWAAVAGKAGDRDHSSHSAYRNGDAVASTSREE